MNIQHIIKKPLITEKSLQRVGQNQYSFEVHKDANKVQVAEAVAQLFDVNVFKVKMMIRKGQQKRLLRSRKTTITAMRKIAIVTIDPKQSIGLFSEFDASKVEAPQEESTKEQTKQPKTKSKKTKAQANAAKEE